MADAFLLEADRRPRRRSPRGVSRDLRRARGRLGRRARLRAFWADAVCVSVATALGASVAVSWLAPADPASGIRLAGSTAAPSPPTPAPPPPVVRAHARAVAPDPPEPAPPPTFGTVVEPARSTAVIVALAARPPPPPPAAPSVEPPALEPLPSAEPRFPAEPDEGADAARPTPPAPPPAAGPQASPVAIAALEPPPEPIGPEVAASLAPAPPVAEAALEAPAAPEIDPIEIGPAPALARLAAVEPMDLVAIGPPERSPDDAPQATAEAPVEPPEKASPGDLTAPVVRKTAPASLARPQIDPVDPGPPDIEPAVAIDPIETSSIGRAASLAAEPPQAAPAPVDVPRRTAGPPSSARRERRGAPDAAGVSRQVQAAAPRPTRPRLSAAQPVAPLRSVAPRPLARERFASGGPSWPAARATLASASPARPLARRFELPASLRPTSP